MNPVTAPLADLPCPPPLPKPDPVALLLPIVRVHRLLFRTKVTAFYESELLTGTCYVTHPKITREMLTTSGMEALRRGLHRSRVIRYDEIKSLRETGMINGRVPSMTYWSGFNQIRVMPTNSWRTTLKIKALEMGNVSQLLIAKTGDRYVKHVMKVRPVWLSWLMALLGVVTLVAGLLGVIQLTSLELLGPGAPQTLLGWGGVVAAMMGAYWVGKSRWKWVKAADLPEEGEVIKKKKRPSGVTKPVRSKILGWLLKLAGLAYWILFAEHWSDWIIEEINALPGMSDNVYYQDAVRIVCMMPVVLLIYIGYRLSQTGYNPKKTDDKRRRIVFLRPFEDDTSASLQPVGRTAALSGVRAKWALRADGLRTQGRMTFMDLLVNSHPLRLFRMFINRGVDTSEEALVRYFADIGPVVAIGEPGEGMQAPGAARMYLSDDDWRSAVIKELDEAQAILVQPGISRGVRWELEYMRAHCQPEKLLMCLVSYWGRPDAYEDMVQMARETLGVELPREVPYLSSPTFVYFDHHWTPKLQPMSFKCPVLWPLTGDGTDLEYSLQPFLQGMHGGDREDPRPSRWVRGFGSWAAKAAAAIIGTIVLGLAIAAVTETGELTRGWLGLETKAQAQETIRQQVSRLFQESARMKLPGKSVPYELMIPESLLLTSSTKPLHEYEYKSADDRIHLTVVANPEEESVLNIAEKRMKMNSGTDYQSTKLEVTRTVELSGVPWVESRIYMKLKNGVSVRELLYAHGSHRGVVLVVLQFINAPEGEDPDLVTGYEILNSLRFVR